MSGDRLSANLHALELRFPRLAAAVRGARPAGDVRVEPARSGDPVPVVRAAGRDWYLHSRYDPRSEGARAAGAVPQPSFAVVFGLGAAYHLRALLGLGGISGTLVVESDVSHLRALAEAVPLEDVLADPRVRLLVGASPLEVEGALLAAYQPVLCGPLSQLALEPRLRTAPDYFLAAAAAVTRASRRSAGDMAVQARFGRRWFVNILGNLPLIGRGAVLPPPASLAVVVAAGPTLEACAGRVARAEGAGALVIATDTALPALLQLGITPAVVLSIDCQAVSYRHFFGGLPPGVCLALDAGSPPLLGRLVPRPLFLASPHPLAALVARTLATLPALDTSGGNVTHAAVGLASLLGAREVEIVGADFSYPGGSPYARGTYFFPWFQSRSTRLAPADSAIVAFVLSDADAPGTRDAAGTRYRSRKLEGYRESLRDRYGPLEEPEPGVLRCRPAGAAVQQERGLAPAAGGWRAWLAAYLKALRSLSPPTAPATAFWSALGIEERNLWTTLLPAAAAMPPGDAEERLEAARAWSCRRIAERLA